MAIEKLNKLLGKLLDKFLDINPGVIIAVAMLGLYFIIPRPEIKDPKDQAYIIKVVDSKANTTILYKNKTIVVASGVLYVCPVGTPNCSYDANAIILTGNFVVEPQQ